MSQVRNRRRGLVHQDDELAFHVEPSPHSMEVVS
jgi:hypothetical protein